MSNLEQAEAPDQPATRPEGPDWSQISQDQNSDKGTVPVAPKGTEIPGYPLPGLEITDHDKNGQHTTNSGDEQHPDSNCAPRPGEQAPSQSSDATRTKPSSGPVHDGNHAEGSKTVNSAPAGTRPEK